MESTSNPFTMPTDGYLGPQPSVPVLREWNSLLTLPLHSLISVDWVVYERVATLPDHAATFVELGRIDEFNGDRQGITAADELMAAFIDSKIRLLRVGS